MWQLLKTGLTGLCSCTSIYRIMLLVWQVCVKKNVVSVSGVRLVETGIK